jgi:FG-GAP-like repeat
LGTSSERMGRWLAGLVMTVGLVNCPQRAPTACNIGDTIYPRGALNPLDPCQSCQPGLNPLAWLPTAGTDCDGGWSFPDGGDDAGLIDAGDAGPPPPDAGADGGVPDASSDGGPSEDAGPSPDAGPCPCCASDASTPGPACVLGPASDLTADAVIFTPNEYDQLASADLNADGAMDLVGVGYAGSAPGLDVFFGQADGTLSSPTHYDGADGLGIAIADLNGDGFPDVVATNGWGSYVGVNVFLNQGNGSFAPPVQYVAPASVRGIGIGDVNGDGAPDLVLAEQALNGVFTAAELRLGDGKGGFGAPITVSVQLGPSVVAADLNNDGLADIVSNGTVLLSETDGGFEVTQYQVGGPVAVLDSLRQGAPDLAFLAQGAQVVSLLRNRGDGHFDDGGTYPPLGGRFRSLASGDFNGDCILDLAMAGFAVGDAGSVGKVMVLFGSPDGGFTAPATIFSETYAQVSGLALLGPVCSPRNLAVGNGIETALMVFGTEK